MSNVRPSKSDVVDARLETQSAPISDLVRLAISEDEAYEYLRPLARFSPGYRVLYGDLASALLEFGGRQACAPGILDVPKSTLQYRIGRVHEIFGGDWDDRDCRLVIMLALRVILPRWRAEANYAREHSSARTDQGVVGRNVGAVGQVLARIS